jgi:hypothetical protein
VFSGPQQSSLEHPLAKNAPANATAKSDARIEARAAKADIAFSSAPTFRYGKRQWAHIGVPKGRLVS